MFVFDLICIKIFLFVEGKYKLRLIFFCVLFKIEYCCYFNLEKIRLIKSLKFFYYKFLINFLIEDFNILKCLFVFLIFLIIFLFILWIK